ncbi:Catechol 2,3-dioxygenase [Amycolatopsis arida]|uniref:Catechol 2,3-dioxygenase n=1 Tax=Amycolatopsis arida TaxID=587909 RepID=A0A1I5LB56_9PSEU|nr:glyoxalase superfamily protein [Amycolatopsis arida]TDX93654.1 catechol 2,3-dioxygenase-like lactoylglutathione lyase family enzyme [Amycolatopsis arida]SFO94413.1 Catechol 2,3-dioxygenase [Amycolatopsis arida]
MKISRIMTITVLVADQERARSFYVDSLGFDVRTDVRMGENRWLEVVPPAAETSIVLHEPFPGTTAGSSQGVILESADIDADVSALRANGVRVEGPHDMPWGRQATFADPDGNGFVLSATSVRSG